MFDYKFLVYKHCPSKPEWGVWHNIYWLTYNNALYPDDVRDVTNQLCTFEYYLHLNTVVFNGAMCYQVSGESEVNKLPKAYYCNWRGGSETGARQTNGPMRWRWVIQLAIDKRLGRQNHLTYHGCINENDVSIFGDDSVLLTSADYFVPYINNQWRDTQLQVMGHLAYSIPSLDYSRPLFIKRAENLTGPIPIDAHAATRAKQRMNPKGVTAFGKYFDLIRALSYTRDRAASEIAIQTDYIFAVYYTELTQVISSMKPKGEEIREYLKKAYQENGEDKPPIYRFGLTRETISTALQTAGAWAQDELPEMQKIYKPFTGPGGDEYVRPHDLQQYVDVADEYLGKLAAGLDFDWTFPYAYPRTDDKEKLRRKPDFIELLF